MKEKEDDCGRGGEVEVEGRGGGVVDEEEVVEKV